MTYKREVMKEALVQVNWSKVVQLMDNMQTSCGIMVYDYQQETPLRCLSVGTPSCCEYRKNKYSLCALVDAMPDELKEEREKLAEYIKVCDAVYTAVREGEYFQGAARISYEVVLDSYNYRFYFQRYALLQGTIKDDEEQEGEEVNGNGTTTEQT